MTTTVKHFHSVMGGTPVLTGAAGTLISVLDACLITGFGLRTADSVVVSGGVATATFSSGHVFQQDVIAVAAGATAPSAINGEVRILTAATNSVTFAAPGLADGAVTGTITMKVAPAGWEKVFAATHIGVYRSQDVSGCRNYLKVDASDGTNARVVGYEVMTDIGSGAGIYPTSDQVSGGGYWSTATNTNAVPRAWTIVADSRTINLHLHTAEIVQGVAGAVWNFGDFDSYRSSDTYASALHCAKQAVNGNVGISASSVEYCASSGGEGPYLPRAFNGLGSAIDAKHFAESYCYANFGASSGNGYGGQVTPSYPNGPNNALILTRKIISENGGLRGALRGVFVTPQSCHLSFTWRDKIQGQGPYAGRTFMAVKCGGPSAGSSAGVIFFDITGPWGA